MFEFFTTLDWAAIAKIIGIDIMLGADNAIVIALACAALPVAMRTKAMFMGTAGAVLLRAGLLAVAGLLLGMSYVKLFAGAYLLYIGYSLLVASGDDEHDVKPASTMFGAMKTIIIADFMMSLDNVMAVAGAAESAGAHSTMYAIAGILFSIPIIIAGAQIIMKLMDRFPIIIWIGSGLLGWVGAEMIMTDPAVHAYFGSDSTHHLIFKILGFGAVVIAALAQKKFAYNHHMEG